MQVVDVPKPTFHFLHLSPLQLNDEDFGASEPWRWLPESVPHHACVLVSVLPDDPKRQLAILTALRERLQGREKEEVEVKTMTAMVRAFPFFVVESSA